MINNIYNVFTKLFNRNTKKSLTVMRAREYDNKYKEFVAESRLERNERIVLAAIQASERWEAREALKNKDKAYLLGFNLYNQQ